MKLDVRVSEKCIQEAEDVKLKVSLLLLFLFQVLSLLNILRSELKEEIVEASSIALKVNFRQLPVIVSVLPEAFLK